MEIEENKQEINNSAKKEPQENKEKSSSSFTPPNENKHNDNIASESVGSWSRSYITGSQIEETIKAHESEIEDVTEILLPFSSFT